VDIYFSVHIYFAESAHCIQRESKRSVPKCIIFLWKNWQGHAKIINRNQKYDSLAIMGIFNFSIFFRQSIATSISIK